MPFSYRVAFPALMIRTPLRRSVCEIGLRLVEIARDCKRLARDWGQTPINPRQSYALKLILEIPFLGFSLI